MVSRGSFILIVILCLVQFTGTVFAQTKPLNERFDNLEGSLPDGWNVDSGTWQVSDGQLLVDAMGGEAYIFFGDNNWQNYMIQVDITFRKLQNASRWCSIVFRGDIGKEKPFSQFPLRFKSTNGNGAEFAVRYEDGWDVRSKARVSVDSFIGRGRKLKVVVRGYQVKGSVDGKTIIMSNFCVDRPTGCVGLGASGCIVSFDNFKIIPLKDTEPPSYRRREVPCEIISHRGFSQNAPENTLAAIKSSIVTGVEACEFDLRCTKDGRAVLLHDDSVNRTTNGKGKIAEIMFAQVKDLDAGSWKAAAYKGEAIPTLDDVLVVLKASNQKAVIDVKDKSVITQLIRSAEDNSMLDQIIVLSPDETVFDKVSSINSRVQKAWLCYNFPKDIPNPASQIKWVTDQSFCFDVQIVVIHYNLVWPELVRKLHAKNIKVWVWTVNNEAVMKCLIGWGVDGITTDRPETLKVARDTNHRDILADQNKLAEAVSP